MSIEFVDPKGNPVFIRRPDLIVALKAYTRDDRQTGEVKTNTVAMFENRDVVFIAGSPEIVNAAIESYRVANSQTLAQLLSAEHHAAEEANSRSDLPVVVQREDCPYVMCPTPLDQCREGCKVVASEAASND